MLTPNATGTGQAARGSLTHRDCMTAPHGARLWVQVQRYNRDGPFVLCGQVLDLADNGVELFKVATPIGEVWAQGRNVRMCSGDGRCTCEAPAAQRSTSC